MVRVVAPDLVSDAKAGSEAAFEALLAPCLESGFRLACGILHDPHAAEDAVQEAAYRAWRKLDRLRSGSPFGPWFLGIVVRQCLSLRRQPWWRVLKLSDLEDRRIERSDDSPIADTDLRRALGKLRPDEQVAVVLYFYLDLPVEQIATISRGSVSAVRGRLARAVKKLRPDLEVEEALR